MKTIVVLTGAAGAGKTTITRALEASGAVAVLKPFTTRPRRGEDEREYHFVERRPAAARTAWAIEHGGNNYGMLNSELDRIEPGKIGLTVFAPMQLDHLERVRTGRPDFEVVIIGLDTIADVAEQAVRVQGAQPRLQSKDELETIRDRLTTLDVTLTGSEAQVTKAVEAICIILSSRGGLITKEFLSPLIAAGTLLTSADQAAIESASYDLRVGNEAWCGGFIDLDAQNSIFEIPPYSYAIVKARETAILPSFVIGQFDLKVSHFLSGVILSNGPQVDPGYRGDLFCMLFNGSSTPRPIRMDDHFATIQFVTTVKVGEPYRGIYKISEKLRRTIPPEAAVGPGGAIFSKVASDIAAAKQEIRSEIPKDRFGLYLSLIGLLAAISVTIAMWGASTASNARDSAAEANRATADAKAATKEAKEAAAALRSSQTRRGREVTQGTSTTDGRHADHIPTGVSGGR